MNTCFVLFSLSKGRNFQLSFDPVLCGIFLNKEEAIKTQEILIKDKQFTAFIMEFPICQTSNDWLEYAKTYIKDKMISETARIIETKTLKTSTPVEYKINRKKIDRV